MCLLRKKLLLFDYTIGKLIEWDREVNKRKAEESLLNFSNTRLMKCIYAICLMSVEGSKQLEDTIFKIFDDFVAYPKGPLEEEIYTNRSSLIRYDVLYNAELHKTRLIENKTYKEEFWVNYHLGLEEFTTDSSKALFRLIEKEQGLKNIIQKVDESIDKLSNWANFPFNDRIELINSTHLGLWYDAYYNSTDKKLITNDLELLKHELHEFKSYVNKLTA